jgi:Bifunctional DNA primase/polymerase, N-terminal
VGALLRAVAAREETCITSPVDYVARAWPIFPCYTIERGKCTCKLGLACTDSGKHPMTQHGFKAATTDLNMINGWMARWPNANWRSAHRS